MDAQLRRVSTAGGKKELALFVVSPPGGVHIYQIGLTSIAP
jgi:hypothetical protein